MCVCVCVHPSQVAQWIKNLTAMRAGKRQGFDSWVRKIPWRRAWQPISVFLPGDSMDRGAQQVTVHSVAMSWIRLKRLAHMVSYTCQALFHTHTLTRTYKRNTVMVPFSKRGKTEAKKVELTFSRSEVSAAESFLRNLGAQTSFLAWRTHRQTCTWNF